jgi:hypothetical protein
MPIKDAWELKYVVTREKAAIGALISMKVPTCR